jgi:hypothetical protein
VQAVDLWVCRHFKVLPTEDRFLNLSDEQKLLLLTSYFEAPLDELAYMAYQSQQTKLEIDESTVKNLKDLGYTEEQLKRMAQQLKIASQAGAEF